MNDQLLERVKMALWLSAMPVRDLGVCLGIPERRARLAVQFLAQNGIVTVSTYLPRRPVVLTRSARLTIDQRFP